MVICAALHRKELNYLKLGLGGAQIEVNHLLIYVSAWASPQ
jgi:hypothetical protein